MNFVMEIIKERAVTCLQFHRACKVQKMIIEILPKLLSVLHKIICYGYLLESLLKDNPYMRF